MPAELWEFMVPTSDVAKLARRPLAVSIEDNIDLWCGRAKSEGRESGIGNREWMKLQSRMSIGNPEVPAIPDSRS